MNHTDARLDGDPGLLAGSVATRGYGDAGLYATDAADAADHDAASFDDAPVPHVIDGLRQCPTEVEAAAHRLALRIRAHLDRATVEVTLTDNRYTMLAVRRRARARAYAVRLHYMFADADPVITRALARYIGDNCKLASRQLGQFIDANHDAVRGRRSKVGPTQVMITAGDHHDLRDIYDRLNQTYFGGTIDAAITWGARTGAPKRRHSIRLGTYAVEDRLIRIHRALDRAFIPNYFVESVVFHEMLHQVHGVPVKNGRREFHSPAFRQDEARHPDHLRSRRWERVNLDALLTY